MYCIKCGKKVIIKTPDVKGVEIVYCPICKDEWNIEEHIDHISWMIEEIIKIKTELGI